LFGLMAIWNVNLNESSVVYVPGLFMHDVRRLLARIRSHVLMLGWLEAGTPLTHKHNARTHTRTCVSPHTHALPQDAAHH
jgi:hypothetical protein